MVTLPEVIDKSVLPPTLGSGTHYTCVTPKLEMAEVKSERTDLFVLIFD